MSTLTISDVGEFELIALLLEAAGPAPSRAGLGACVTLAAGDDCAAVLPAPGTLSLHTTDTMVETVHFLPSMPAQALGWKSLAANISDIASMGGVPTIALITVAIPSELEVSWLVDWYRGLGECARRFGVAVVGGDVVRMPSGVCITVSLDGEVERDRLITRSGAHVGDKLVITGTPGDSAAGLRLWHEKRPVPERLWEAHLRPVPRVFEARAAVRMGGVSAMMDLSDGLAGDLQHLCRASRVGAKINEDGVPLSEDLLVAAKEMSWNPLELAISGGEDYELLLCVRPGSLDRVLQAIALAGQTVGTVIGEIVPEDEGLTLAGASGTSRPLGSSFTHF